MSRFNWREDVWLPPTKNCSSYCKSCKGYTYWKIWERWPDLTLKCTKCDRKVKV
jgi:hypothetical protein